MLLPTIVQLTSRIVNVVRTVRISVAAEDGEQRAKSSTSRVIASSCGAVKSNVKRAKNWLNETSVFKVRPNSNNFNTQL